MSFELRGKMVYSHGGSLHLKSDTVEKRLKKVYFKIEVSFEREKVV